MKNTEETLMIKKMARAKTLKKAKKMVNEIDDYYEARKIINILMASYGITVQNLNH